MRALDGLRTYQDAVAVVTGGASGLGRALADELARRGAEVVVADLQTELAEEAAATIRAAGGRAVAETLDVTDAPAVERLVLATFDRTGRLDYLFNNAGIAIVGEAQLHKLDDWNRVIDVNLGGVVHGVNTAYPLMLRQGFGHIVNTGSFMGLVPCGSEVSYGTTKFGIVGLSTSLRIEAAAAGVRVSVICPGAVFTPIANGGKFGKLLQPMSDEAVERFWSALHPVPAKLIARQALDRVAKNHAVIVVPARYRWIWRLYRYAPALVTPFLRRHFTRYRQLTRP